MKLSGDTGFMTASKFSRLSAAGLKALKPVTVILHRGQPVGVAVAYDTFLELQEVLDIGRVGHKGGHLPPVQNA